MTDVLVRFRVEATLTREQIRAWFESNGWVSSGEDRWRHPRHPSREAHVPLDSYAVERIAYASCMDGDRNVMPDQVYREMCGEPQAKIAIGILQRAHSEEINRWREVGEAAHEHVSVSTDYDECPECMCLLPETSEDPHSKRCKVGRLVHALSAVGIDPNDR